MMVHKAKNKRFKVDVEEMPDAVYAKNLKEAVKEAESYLGVYPDDD